MEEKRKITRDFFTSGQKECYSIDVNKYNQNEAIFFKLIHSNVYSNFKLKQEFLENKPKGEAVTRTKKNGAEYTKT